MVPIEKLPSLQKHRHSETKMEPQSLRRTADMRPSLLVLLSQTDSPRTYLLAALSLRTLEAVHKRVFAHTSQRIIVRRGIFRVKEQSLELSKTSGSYKWHRPWYADDIGHYAVRVTLSHYSEKIVLEGILWHGNYSEDFDFAFRQVIKYRHWDRPAEK